MTIDFKTLLEQLFLSGLMVGFWAILTAVWMWLYYLWKTEIQPLTKGLQWGKVSYTERKYTNGEVRHDYSYGWLDPKTFKGPIKTEGEE